eukprot:g80261.t1
MVGPPIEERLYDAAQDGLLTEARQFLEAKAAVNFIHPWTGWTSLITAAAGGHTDMVKLLLDNKAEIDVQDGEGYTALHRASSHGYTDVIRELQLRGANVLLQHAYGRTALQEASKANHTEAVSVLAAPIQRQSAVQHILSQLNCWPVALNALVAQYSALDVVPS